VRVGAGPARRSASLPLSTVTIASYGPPETADAVKAATFASERPGSITTSARSPMRISYLRGVAVVIDEGATVRHVQSGGVSWLDRKVVASVWPVSTAASPATGIPRTLHRSASGADDGIRSPSMSSSRTTLGAAGSLVPISRSSTWIIGANSERTLTRRPLSLRYECRRRN
jgi:hypothetical protein